jgi:hypothetical protein
MDGGCAGELCAVRPPVSGDVRLDLAPGPFVPGATVAGTIRLPADETDVLEVALEYSERTEEYEQVARRVALPGLDAGDDQLAHFRFEIVIPEDALPNYESQHGRLGWRLHVKTRRQSGEADVYRDLAVELKRTAF